MPNGWTTAGPPSRPIPSERAPGERFHYSSADAQVLGLVLRAATGKTLSDYLSEKIWQPMGAEDDASVAALRAALDAGCTFVDTALAYGNGHSERLVAKALEGRTETVAVASKIVIDRLVHAGYAEGPVYPLYRDRGAVILVKKGNPKQICSVWDLGRKDVRLVTPNPKLEPGAFGNYLATLYGIAVRDEHPPKQMSAGALMNGIFNNTGDDACKWLAGPRIHHPSNRALIIFK